MHLPVIHVRALGALQVTLRGSNRAALTQPRRLALLLYLLLAEPRGMQSRSLIMALLWPDASTDQGRQALRNSLHGLRRALGSAVIVTSGHDLVGVDESLIECDVHRLEENIAAYVATELTEQPLLLANGFNVSCAPEFERWLESTRLVMQRSIVAAARRLARTRRAANDLSGAIHALHFAQLQDVDNEELLRERLELLAHANDLPGVSQAYRAFAMHLAEEYGSSPSASTSATLSEITSRLLAHAVKPTRLTIALLPIVDARDDRNSNDLAQILSDGITRRLARLNDLSVIARGSLYPYRDRTISPLDAGRQLGADIVVDAMLTSPPGIDDHEVCLEVIRVADGTLLREATVRATRKNLFVLEGAIAAAIAPSLGLDAHESTQLVKQQQTRNAEAYIHYVRGTYLFLRNAHVGGTIDGLHECRAHFELALARDPEFGAAYAGLSNYFAVCSARGVIRPFAAHFRHVIELCDRALALDPSLAIPHVHYGVRAMYLECDWPAAAYEFQRAIDLDPHCPEAHRFLGIWLAAHGRFDEGLAKMREGLRLEPQIVFFHNSLADALLSLARYEEAIAVLHDALLLEPNYPAAQVRLIRCLEKLERYSTAIDVRRSAFGDGEALKFSMAFAADGAAGYRAERAIEARKAIDIAAVRAESSEPTPADLFNPPELFIALTYAELGEWKNAFAWEQHACMTQPGKRQWFIGRPELSNLARYRKAEAVSAVDVQFARKSGASAPGKSR